MIRSLFALIAGLMLMAQAFAQGGPPMVTDDPGTPGDGRWEINVGMIASHSRGHREIDGPDLDINYGWGDRIQLKADVPWTSVKDDGSRWRSGVGTGNFGVKWRFVDGADSGKSGGIDISTYPQYSRSLLRSSERRGIADGSSSFLLPIEVAGETAGFSWTAEVGRDFVRHDPDRWIAGVIGGHACGEGIECLLELHRTQGDGQRLTLLNFGFHWKLMEGLTALGAIGHEFGSRTDERRQLLAYLGVQIAR